MEGVARPKLTLDGYGPLLPGTSVSSCEAERPIKGQSSGLVAATLTAVLAKSMNPVQVDYERARR
jgi:hypothetical protein